MSSLRQTCVGAPENVGLILSNDTGHTKVRNSLSLLSLLRISVESMYS